MNLPRLAVYPTDMRLAPSLLLQFQIERLQLVRDDKQDSGPRKPQPEIPAPDRDEPSPDIVPEIPNVPKTPETEKPAGGAEITPAPDVVEMPDMPQQPEVGVPARDLPGGTLH